MGTPRKMMRSIISREKTSIVATFNWRSSMIVGEMYSLLIDRKLCSFKLLIPACRSAYFSNSFLFMVPLF